MSHRLSKSKFLSASQCSKKIWLEIHENEKSTPLSESQESIFESGINVGELARSYFPNGEIIDLEHYDVDNGLKKTILISKDNPYAIYEGFFLYDDVIIRPDILKNNFDGTWDLIEVKSSTSLKSENIVDLAIQNYVINSSHIKIKNSYLMHINKNCIYPDLTNLFSFIDLSEKIKPFVNEMHNNLSNLREILRSSEPKVDIGAHCNKPYVCDFKQYCWQHIPEYSIFNIPGLYMKKKEQMYKNDIVKISDLNDNYSFKSKEKKFIDSFLTKSPLISKYEIRQEINSLIYPLYFLDFETYGSPIPKFSGMKPFQQYPFQFSCHILYKNNTLEHIEYLHQDQSDPRKGVINELIKACGKSGTIIAYNASFEKGVINKLSSQFPEYSQKLNTLIGRFWDQLVIFRKYYCDYRFKGSNSIKSVLPVLVPELSYSKLKISDGSQAQIGYKKMIELPNGEEKKNLTRELYEYCKLDTLAMVEIHKHLLKI